MDINIRRDPKLSDLTHSEKQLYQTKIVKTLDLENGKHWSSLYDAVHPFKIFRFNQRCYKGNLTAQMYL